MVNLLSNIPLLTSKRVWEEVTERTSPEAHPLCVLPQQVGGRVLGPKFLPLTSQPTEVPGHTLSSAVHTALAASLAGGGVPCQALWPFWSTQHTHGVLVLRPSQAHLTLHPGAGPKHSCSAAEPLQMDHDL